MTVLRTKRYCESAARASDPLLYVLQRAREVRGQEAPLAAGKDEHLVLDADAESALGQVDARLDGEDRAGGKRRAVEPRVVHVEPDEMSEAVDELVEVAGFLERRLGGLLQIAHVHARLYCPEG